MKIRNIVGEMPFDRMGVHATGREVYRKAADGIHWSWFPEYENDFTVDMEVTETAEEYEERRCLID